MGTPSLQEQLQSDRNDLTLKVGKTLLKVTSLSKELWPGITKRDLLTYYAGVGDYMLPHLQDRPLAFVRYPDGLSGDRFFQKHWDKGRPKFLQTVTVWSETNGRTRDWLLANDLVSLLWLCQISSLEIHPWYSRITPKAGLAADFKTEESLDESVLNYPDFVVFDLDPNLKNTESTFNKAAFRKTIDVAKEVREVLHELGLEAFLKTSGKTGLHLYIPIQREYAYEETKPWAEKLGRRVEARCKSDVTMEWSLDKRPNKIFIDHNQNVRGKTLVGVYSTRPALNATVSFPIDWDELEDVDPREFTIKNVPGLLEKRGDLWKGMLSKPQELKPLPKATLR